MNDDIIKILHLAVQAPSSDNTQPWKFSVQGDRVDIFDVMKEKTSLHEFLLPASLVSHGALLEYLVIAASHFGYRPKIDLSVHNEDPTHIATVTFSRDLRSEEDPLFFFLAIRRTNRKKYLKKGILHEHEGKILRAPQELGFGSVVLVEKRKDIALLAGSFAVSMRVILTNKKLHEYLFKMLRWSKKEVEHTKDGMPVKTLEVRPIDLVMLWVSRSWPLQRVLNFLGMAYFAAWTERSRYASSGAIGAILVNGNTPADLIDAGRVFARTWLHATEAGLSIQPLAGIALYTEWLTHVPSPDDHLFSPEQRIKMERAALRVHELVHAGTQTLAMCFRAGYGNDPCASSPRRMPRIIFPD